MLLKHELMYQLEGGNCVKWVKMIVIALFSLICIAIVVLFECKAWPVGSSVAGIALGFSLPALVCSIQDLCDTTNWKQSQRKLKRGGYITEDTIIRISFAYLFRIKVGNKYMLVKNNRGTGKYQPVGGVYKMKGGESLELKNLYNVMDDNKIPIDRSSRDDYRLRIKNKYLRKFVKRFDGKARREKLDNLGRELKEELIDTGLVAWKSVKYRFCGRHMSEVQFSEHFQSYELLLADVVEVLPTVEQEQDLLILMQHYSDAYCFVTGDEISSLGVNTAIGDLKETISDHTHKILQESEGELMKVANVGRTYTVPLI